MLAVGHGWREQARTPRGSVQCQTNDCFEGFEVECVAVFEAQAAFTVVDVWVFREVGGYDLAAAGINGDVIRFEVHFEAMLGHFREIRKFLSELKISKTLGA